jgi:hypothetical protein
MSTPPCAASPSKNHLAEAPRLAAASPAACAPRWPWLVAGLGVVALAFAVGLLARDARWWPPRPAPAPAATSPPAPAGEHDEDFISEEIDTLDSSVPTVRIEQELEVDPRGDARVKALIKMPADRLEAFKERMSRVVLVSGAPKRMAPKMANVLPYLELERAGFLLEGVGGAFEDEAIRIHGQVRGWARLRDGRWVTNLSNDPKARYRLLKKKGRVVTLRALVKEEGMQLLAQMVVTLPEGAHDVRVQDRPNDLAYAAPAPPAGAEAGTGQPALSVRAKPHLMAALYKLYSDLRFEKLWVARAVFRNRGTEPVTDYRVRFRLAGYSEWSGWQRCDVVYPGQTVVDAFHPVVDGKVRELRGPTPVDVQVEYSYVRANGEKVTDLRSERTRVLGMNEAVYSDLELNADSTFFEVFKDVPLVLASFTTVNDPVIQDVVGRLGRSTAGAAPALRDDHALRFLRAAYDLLRLNIAYETTPGGAVDGLLHQHLKYGRDVLRTKSGTCVNTSILYASVAEAAGLSPYILVVPGHAFVAVRLPVSKRVVFVETTGCAGGTLATSIDFDRACAAATQTYQRWSRAGLIAEVDVRRLHARGVVPPELPDLGRNPLQERNLVFPSPTPPAAPRPGPAPARAAATPVVGAWDVRTTTADGKAGVAVAVFRGDGTYAIGPTFDAPKARGRYTYAGNTLTLLHDGKEDKGVVRWSADGNGFELQDAAARATFQRRPVGATVLEVRQERDVERAGRKGLLIHLRLQINHAPGLPCEALAAVVDRNGRPVEARGAAHRGPDGGLLARAELVPAHVFTVFPDATLFVPYEELVLAPGTHDLRFRVNVRCVRDDKLLIASPAAHDFRVHVAG